MSIRSNTLGLYPDIAPELQELLRRNGIRAHIMREGERFSLLVKGHDSPLLTYPLDAQQLSHLRDGDTTYANRVAYETFASIVSKDFNMPKDYVHAKNAGSRVAMGLHGYRVDGIPFAFVGERQGGRLRPGELQSGSYGFYYKGQDTNQQQESNLLAEQLKNIEIKRANLKTGIPYSEAITSDVYFSNEKWQEVLSSHGIVIDDKKQSLKIQSAAINLDYVYDLTEEEVQKLTSNSIKDVPVEERLSLINNIIKDDYNTLVTRSMLESKEQIDLKLNRVDNTQILSQQESLYEFKHYQNQYDPRYVATVNGESLRQISPDEGWYREVMHGREVNVGEIRVEPLDGKYRMTAVINGESISHEITQKQYEKFMAVDDYHRMKLFSKVFSEVEMKGDNHNVEKGLGITTGILAALTIFRPRPEFYLDHHICGSGRIYMKPGVDSPQDIACRAFDAGVNATFHHGFGLDR